VVVRIRLKMVISTCKYKHPIVQFNVHILFCRLSMLFRSVLLSISCFKASGKLAGSAIPAEALKYFGRVDTCIRPSLLMERFSFASFVQRLAGPELRVPLLGDACLDQSSGM
jgi:hypothetical protein